MVEKPYKPTKNVFRMFFFLAPGVCWAAITISIITVSQSWTQNHRLWDTHWKDRHLLILGGVGQPCIARGSSYYNDCKEN